MNNSPLQQILKYGYENHAFISWPHSIEERGKKIVNELQRALEDKMKNEIRGGGKVFLDIVHLEVGYKWEEFIPIKLCRSAVLIVILVPVYFQSDYCLIEWAITEKLQGFRLPASNSYETCFIYILLRRNNIYLPEEINKIQFNEDFSALMTYRKNFTSSSKWLRLIDELFNNIKRICESICETGQPTDEEWKHDEDIARTTSAKQFTFPVEKKKKTRPPRKERSLPQLNVEKK